MGKCIKRLLLRRSATDNIHLYTVNGNYIGTCLGQITAQIIVHVQSNKGANFYVLPAVEVILKR